MEKKLIVSNWKMAPDTLAEAREILDSANDFLESAGGEINSTLVFCPPFVFLEEVGKILKMSRLEDPSFLGAQDIFWEDQGSDTGEISGPMLKKLGVDYVIVGHSERRWKLGESNETVNKKLKAALRNEIVPIVCVGERERNFSADRVSSKASAVAQGGSASGGKDFLKNQVSVTFSGLSRDELEKCIIAYEPVWAISTTPGARPDTPQSALESISVIKEVLAKNYSLISNHYLYGGSVTSKNVADFLSQKEIDGVLIGSASVNKEEFIKILSAAAKLSD